MLSDSVGLLPPSVNFLISLSNSNKCDSNFYLSSCLSDNRNLKAWSWLFTPLHSKVSINVFRIFSDVSFSLTYSRWLVAIFCINIDLLFLCAFSFCTCVPSVFSSDSICMVHNRSCSSSRISILYFQLLKLSPLNRGTLYFSFSIIGSQTFLFLVQSVTHGRTYFRTNETTKTKTKRQLYPWRLVTGPMTCWMDLT